MTIFIVEGDGLFPFDMLRYDRCWPATEADAALLNTGLEIPIRRQVSLEFTVMNHMDARPSAARWQRFGWLVKEHAVAQPAKQAARRELDHRGRR